MWQDMIKGKFCKNSTRPTILGTASSTATLSDNSFDVHTYTLDFFL